MGWEHEIKPHLDELEESQEIEQWKIGPYQRHSVASGTKNRAEEVETIRRPRFYNAGSPVYFRFSNGIKGCSQLHHIIRIPGSYLALSCCPGLSRCGNLLFRLFADKCPDSI